MWVEFAERHCSRGAGRRRWVSVEDAELAKVAPSESTGDGVLNHTVIRHVQNLQSTGLLETNRTGKAKRVKATRSGRLLSMAWFGVD